MHVLCCLEQKHIGSINCSVSIIHLNFFVFIIIWVTKNISNNLVLLHIYLMNINKLPY